jgi:putative flippase GtrA
VRRWTIFNLVGLMGFCVQLAVLSLLVRMEMHYLTATCLAIEAAVLHNFLWHQRWTWRDRGLEPGNRLQRLVRFHALNGAVSLAGNMALMWALVGPAGLPPIPANVIAVGVCAIVNYLASERLVFQR